MKPLDFYRVLGSIHARMKGDHGRLVDLDANEEMLGLHWETVDLVSDEMERIWQAIPKPERDAYIAACLGRVPAPTSPPPDPTPVPPEEP